MAMCHRALAVAVVERKAQTFAHRRVEGVEPRPRFVVQVRHAEGKNGGSVCSLRDLLRNDGGYLDQGVGRGERRGCATPSFDEPRAGHATPSCVNTSGGTLKPGRIT